MEQNVALSVLTFHVLFWRLRIVDCVFSSGTYLENYVDNIRFTRCTMMQLKFWLFVRLPRKIVKWPCNPLFSDKQINSSITRITYCKIYFVVVESGCQYIFLNWRCLLTLINIYILLFYITYNEYILNMHFWKRAPWTGPVQSHDLAK